MQESYPERKVEAVHQGWFEPASLNGEPVRVLYSITINYRLDGDATDV